MPTYAYLCGACEARVEFFQSMREGPKRKCPQCGRLKLQRQIGGGAGFIFKGSGFYETDYRSESYKQSEAAERSAQTSATDGDSDASKPESSGAKSTSEGGSSAKSSSDSGSSKGSSKSGGDAA